MDKNISEVYNLINVLSVKFKITSIEESLHHLYIGDSSGYLHKYFLNRSESEFIRESSTSSQQFLSKQITSSKIDIIKTLPFGRDLIVLSNSNLYHIDGDSLTTRQTLISGGVINITLNESNAQKNEVLVALKNNKLVILEFNINSGEFIKEKLVIPPLSDSILTFSFLGSLIYIGTKKEYGMIDLNKKLQPISLAQSMVISPYAHIKVIDNDELFFVISQNNIGVLTGKDGKLKNHSTFNLLIKPILQISVQKPYLIVLYEAALQIFNMQDSKVLQQIEFQGGAKRLVASQNTIIYATQQKLTLLREIPFDARIKDCLTTCRIDDAMGIFYQSINKDDPSFKDKEEALYLDAAWNLIENARFREARLKFENRDFDLREILALFKEYIPLSLQNKVTFNNNRNITVITGKIQDRNRSEACEKDAFEMLIDLLEKRRNKYNNQQFKSQWNQKVPFMKSSYSLAPQRTDITLGELMTLVDYALILIFVKHRDTLRLTELFKSNKDINCREFDNEIFASMRDANFDIKEPEIIAYFFEKFGKVKEALDKWKEIGQNLNSKYDNACNETIRILLKEENSKRITDYLGWTIKKNVEFGKEFFKKVKESVIPPDQMLAYLSEGVYSKAEQGLTEKLIEIYLEIIVTEKKITESRFHTRLASLYIDSLFKLTPAQIPKDKDLKDVIENLSSLSKKVLQKLVSFYQNPSSNYDPSFLLEKVKGSWLVNEEIYFYGKSKKHREALEQLIIKLQAYKMAEDYCLQHNDKTLTIMFTIYIKQYKQACGYLKRENNSETQQQMLKVKRIWEDRINIFIKKFSAHPELDSLEVLREIPDDWKLVEFSSRTSNADDGLYSFLTQIISSSLHTRRQVNCAKHLSEMDLQNVKCQLINSKQANVRITEDKKCSICHKAIGDQIVCIYPNAVVAHQKCVTNGQSLSICPQTLQDFEKTFRG